ncbi:MAG TPA: TatD family hydrolase [Pseudoxanthomonas sp.]|nr:TatD family hydrolase [Pseudoxanthomonas sp.]
MLVDTHCHLDVAEFDPDREQVLARAQAASVLRQVVPAIDADSWPRLRAVCGTDAGLFAAYGLHPMFLDSHRPRHLQELGDWIERERPVAVGECGLDFYVEGLDAEAQRVYFEEQLALARDFGLPVIVHARRAVDAVIQAIRRIAPPGGVVHSFAGSAQQAAQLWKLGFMVGIGASVTYPRARRLRALVSGLPIEQLLLETDAPDQPDAGHRGQRNEPARLVRVCETIAGLRGMSFADVAAATTFNAERLFQLPAR